jgi:hypothetical protein
MQSSNGSVPAATLEREPAERKLLARGLCAACAGVLGVAVCLQILAGAVAAGLALAMVALGLSGGSVGWAIGIAAAFTAGGCVLAAYCRFRTAS